ncbi:MAG: DEAD/DEAH box helicase [Nitrosopumilus sp.]|nr:DEAD/DEAH box helicase [Nitrosopumilus sp.]
MNRNVIGWCSFPEFHNGININENKMSNIDKGKLICELKTIHVTNLLKNLYKESFEKPSLPQAMGVIPLINGKDVINQFNSGTGKTLTFVLGALFGLDLNNKSLQYIFMANTHEVARQIGELIKKIVPDAKIILSIGQGNTSRSGSSNTRLNKSWATAKNNSADDSRTMTSNEMFESMHNGCQIIVGTIGRTHALFDKEWKNSKSSFFKNVKMICLDEYDQLVTPSTNTRREEKSEDQKLLEIISMLPNYTQRAFFSATVIRGSDDIARKYFRNYKDCDVDPFMILMDEESQLLRGIRHFYVSHNFPQQKFETIIDLLKEINISQCIIFVNNKNTGYQLHDRMKAEGFDSVFFNNDCSSDDRLRMFEDLKACRVRYVIGTDVIARGVDFQSVSMVINCDFPIEMDTYIHRIGRCGRFGRKGIAINLAVNDHYHQDMDKIARINEVYKENQMNELINLNDLSAYL